MAPPSNTRDEEADLPPLVRALLRPSSYPHRPDSVELVQTHISWVFLAGDRVFKVKKPVRFPFLDYSTLERRLFFCREEVRLNRRLAPDVYFGAVPILGHGDEVKVCAGREGEGHWPVVEYAVAMRRLPARQLLDSRLRRGEVGFEDVRAVARRLAAFHREASTEAAARYGSPEAIRDLVCGNLEQVRPFVGHTVTGEEWDELDRRTRAFLDSHRGLFEERLREGRVREGHGDLRAEHICLADGIDVFDCVEFSEAFRYGDVVSEIAFLAMDLEFLEEPILARELLAAYAREAGDAPFREIWPFYGCYRACVRGKVESLKSRETEVPEHERGRARREARRHFRMALRYLREPLPPALIVVCGPAGSGKTTVSHLLAAELGFPILRSDVLRKRLAGLSPTDRVPPAEQGRIYGAVFNARTYARLEEETRRLLERGEGAIVDATFLERDHRRPFLELARRRGLPFVFVECRAGDEEILRRLETRAHDRREASDAGPEVFLAQRGRFEPLDEVPEAHGLVADTAGDLDEAIRRVRRALLSSPSPGPSPGTGPTSPQRER